MNPPMPEPDHCPQCGTPLSPGALAGLCPACLLKAGAAADTVTDARQPSFIPPAIAELAAKFPQLEILELIGKGGMGAVYKARQKQLDRLVALKILPPGIGSDAAFAERFTREARALAKLNHPNIVTLYEFGETNGQFYFLMEFVDGVNLRQLLNHSRISPREALAIVPQICDALQFAHDHGIVHRDIKPENILLDRYGRVKVADFGLAKIVAAYDRPDPESSDTRQPPAAVIENLTDAGKVMGTPKYMSPEQAENPGDVDHRADIYALGVVFYQMLTGELPGKKIEPPSKKVQIDVRLDEIVLRALKKKPELRFQQASAFKTQVETISAEPEKPEIQNPKPKVKSRLSRTTLAVAACVAIIVATLALFMMKQHYATPATQLSQSEFMSMFESNQIAHATINMSSQTSQLTPISGTYYRADQDGKLTKEEVPFIAPNILLTQKMLDELLPSDRIEADAPNKMLKMLMGVVWGIAPFLILGISMLIVPGIIIYVVWRVVKKPAADPVPPLIQKPDRFWRWFLVTTLAMIIVVFLIAMLGLIAAIVIPNFVKARERAQALHRQQMATAAPSEIPTNFFIGQAYFPWGDSIEITSVERTENQMTVNGHYNLVSHDSSLLALYITTSSTNAVPTDSKQTIQISKGQGDFELTDPNLVPGLPHVSMYSTNGHPFAAIYFGDKAEALEESRAVWITNTPSASAETWSPTLAPDEKPDLQKIRDEIKTLMDQGDYEGALQRQLWYFNHARQFGEINPIRLSFGIMNWHELGQRYPKAKQALTEIRDKDVRQFSEGRGYGELFLEIQSLNRELHDDGATLALFKTIYQQDKHLAESCYYYVQDSLMQNGDYDLCLKCIGNPQAHFESFRRSFEMQKENQERLDEMRNKYPMPVPPALRLPSTAFIPPRPPDMGQMATNNFVGEACELVEILVATGHKADAEKIRDEAVNVLDDPRLQSAVSDAEEKINGKLVQKNMGASDDVSPKN